MPLRTKIVCRDCPAPPQCDREYTTDGKRATGELKKGGHIVGRFRAVFLNLI